MSTKGGSVYDLSHNVGFSIFDYDTLWLGHQYEKLRNGAEGFKPVLSSDRRSVQKNDDENAMSAIRNIAGMLHIEDEFMGAEKVFREINPDIEKGRIQYIEGVKHVDGLAMAA